MNSSNGDRPQRRPGFPIRTPSDQRLVGSSPRPIAASHVLHRPTMPRHPPCALTTQHTNTQEQSQTEKLLDKIELTEKQDARVHYPVLTQHPHTTEQTTTQQPACSTQQPVQQEQQHVCHPRHPTAHQQPTNTKKGKHHKTFNHHLHARRPPSLKQSNQQVFHPKNKKATRHQHDDT